MMVLFRKKAQSTAEYVIVLGLIVAAVMAMQTYIKRGFQGRIKDAVDYVDNGGTNIQLGNTGQYEPYYLTSSFKSGQDQSEESLLGTGGTVNRTSNSKSTREGWHNVGDTNNAD